MAFTRKELKNYGLNDEQVENIMTLHGTSMSGYIPKSQVDDQVTAAVQKATDGADIKALQEKANKADDLEKQIGTMKFDTAVNGYLGEKGVKKGAAMKMVRSLLDSSKIKIDDKGTISGLDDQITEISKDESVASLFKPDDGKKTETQPTPPAKPQFGVQPLGKMPNGTEGQNFADFMSFIPKKK